MKDIKDNVQKVEGANVFLLGHKCYRCKHEWLPSDKDILPKVCPKCKSPYWDRQKVRFTKNDKKR